MWHCWQGGKKYKVDFFEKKWELVEQDLAIGVAITANTNICCNLMREVLSDKTYTSLYTYTCAPAANQSAKQQVFV